MNSLKIANSQRQTFMKGIRFDDDMTNAEEKCIHRFCEDQE